MREKWEGRCRVGEKWQGCRVKVRWKKSYTVRERWEGCCTEWE